MARGFQILARIQLHRRHHPQHRALPKSTGETTLSAAKNTAKQWYLDLLAKVRVGQPIHAKTFDLAADAFLKYQDKVQAVSDGQRRNYHQKWSLLKPHLTGVRLTDINLDWLETLRSTRGQAKTRSASSCSRSRGARRNATVSVNAGWVMGFLLSS